VGINKLRCEVCDTIDLLILSPPHEGHYYCSEHNPGIKAWHNQFPKRLYDPQKDLVINNSAGLTFE
jgi:hypothetical protein